MSSIDLHTKLSGHEVKTWYLASLDLEVDTMDGEAAWESFMDYKPKDFKCPRRKGGKKASTPSCIEDAEQHDETKCDTRVYKGPSVGGWGCQCSSKKVEGERLCKAHQNEANKNDGMVRNGFINEDRPTHHYGDENNAQIPWHDVELPEKVSKAKKSSGDAPKRGKRKCSGCGEVGHTLPKCPKASTKPDKVFSAADLKAMLKAAEKKEQEEVEKLAENSELDEDTTVKTISFGDDESKSDEEDESQSDEEDESKSDKIYFEFEGVEYRRSGNKVVDLPDRDNVGEWDVVNESISFSKFGRKNHRMRKAAL